MGLLTQIVSWKVLLYIFFVHDQVARKGSKLNASICLNPIDCYPCVEVPGKLVMLCNCCLCPPSSSGHQVNAAS